MNDLQVAVATTLGALLVLVAAWLLIVRRDAGQNRGKFLGIELELSTPALVVLLVGAGLLIGPAFAPRRPGGWPPMLFASTTTLSGAGAPEGGTILRQQTIVSDEFEPNNRPGEANVVGYGATVSGTLNGHDPIDHYVVNAHQEQMSPTRFVVRFISSGFYVTDITILDSKEETLASGMIGVGPRTISKSVRSSSSYLVQVRLNNDIAEGDVNYEVGVYKETK